MKKTELDINKSHKPIQLGFPRISWPILFVILLAGGQELQLLFNTPFVVYGRWFGVGILTVWGICYFLFYFRYISLEIKWLLFLLPWVIWYALAVIINHHQFNDIMINILVPIPLMIIGISLTTFQKSQKQILATLTYTYFILNLALLILSLLYRVFFAGHAFFLIGNVTVPQVVGAFRRPTYLSWAAANVLLCAIVSLMTMHRSSFSKNKKILWYFIFIVASYFLLASKIRGSLFAVIIASIIFFASKGITKALYLALILSLVFGLIFIFASNQIYSVLRIEDNASYIDWYNFTSGRLSIFERSIREIEANPAILIIGQPDRGEVYMSGLQDYRSEDWHDPLWMFHEFGLIGVFFFYGLLISLIIQIFKKSKRAVINRNNIWTVEIPLVLIIRNVITSLADSNLVIGHMDHIFFWICIGILICKPDDLKIYSIKRNTANPAVTIGKTSINNIVS